ncbi:MAG: CBS domain-containing protein [Nanoarchaeota archaeon]
MTEKPIFLKSSDSLQTCAEEMDRHHVGAIIIKDNGNIMGVLTEQDIVRKCVAKGLNPIDKKVSEVMETNLITISPDIDIFDALMKMKDFNIRHLPVVDGKKLLGLLTLKDILKIEPQLFDLLVEKFELREEERKPINTTKPNEGICHECGEYSEEVKEKGNVFVCDSCKK